MYIDPEAYNPDELKGEDATLMRGYDLAVDDALGFLDTCAEDAVTGVKAFDKLYRQVVAQVRERLEHNLEGCRLEHTAGIMDADESYWEK